MPYVFGSKDESIFQERVFANSRTWSPPFNCRAYVTVIGPGGSGGSARGTNADRAHAASGGGGGNGDDTNEKANGYVYIYNAGNSSKYTFITTQNLEFQNTVFRVEFGGGVLPQASVVDGIRLKMHDAGNISGTTKLYGVKQL